MTSDVLVLRALGLGDALTGIPALRGVRRAWPDRRLWLAAPAATGRWLQELGIVDEVLDTAGLGAPLRWPGSGHVAVNLHGRGPQSHALLQATLPDRLVAFASSGHRDGPRWRADEHEVDRWCRLVRSAGGACDRDDLRLRLGGGHRSDEVLLHPGAASPARRWPPERWVVLARHLGSCGVPVTVTGGPDEHDLCDEIRAQAGPGVRTAGALSLAALADRVAGARLLVCGDTGVAHLATATGTPSVVLFGPVPPAWWGPAIDPDRHHVIWHGDGSGDPHGTALDPALEAIGTDEVVSAVERLLASG